MRESSEREGDACRPVGQAAGDTAHAHIAIRRQTWGMRASGLVALAGAVALAAGCAGHLKAAPDTHANPSPGFLQNYRLLQPVGSDADYRRYVAPNVDFTAYRKFMLAAPEIIVSTGDQYQALDANRLNEITAYYVQAMSAALGRHYQVVAEPGPGVALLRAAVVGAVEVRQPIKPRNLMPYSAMFKAARVVTGTDPYVLRVSMESELVDSRTGALLGEAVDTRQGTKTILKGHEVSSGQLQQVIDFWVDRFVSRLDKANGFTS